MKVDQGHSDYLHCDYQEVGTRGTRGTRGIRGTRGTGGTYSKAIEQCGSVFILVC